jgi:hypothetical protein
MKILEIYRDFEISEKLQEHQLRVAAVSSIICDNFTEKVDKKNIVTADLLHDMGNILKFNFEVFSDEFFEPQGRKYWKKVKREFHKKYGGDEHVATLMIAREVGVNEKVLGLIGQVGFSQGKETLKSSRFERKVAAYSDHRVTPFGVTSMRERLLEGRKRYAENKSAVFDARYFDEMVKYWEKVEKQIFKKCRILPDDITNESVAPVVEELRDFEVEAS